MKELEPKREVETEPIDDPVLYWATEMLAIRVQNKLMTQDEANSHLRKLRGDT